jgi:hypothetical protein
MNAKVHGTNRFVVIVDGLFGEKKSADLKQRYGRMEVELNE